MDLQVYSVPPACLSPVPSRVFLGWAWQQLPHVLMPCWLSLRAAARSAYKLWQRC